METFKLLVIIPNSGMDEQTLHDRKLMLESYASPGTEITVECIPAGPESVETEWEEIEAGYYVLQRVKKVQTEDYQAIIVYCADDPAVRAARELSHIPVIGPGSVSLMLAQDLGNKYSIIVPLEDTVPSTEMRIRRFLFDGTRCCSIRSIPMPVISLRDDLEQTYKVLLEVGKKCVEEDGAHVLVLACLGMAGLGERLQEALGVPVIDPAPASVRYAELLHYAGLQYSRLSYP